MGYVGITSALVFAELGWKVSGLDPDECKITSLLAGRVPFYEPGLDSLLKKHILSGNLTFGSDPVAAVQNNTVIFICVGTPSTAKGEADLQYIRQASRWIGAHMQTYKLVVIKSTVPVGTQQNVTRWIGESQPVPIPCDVVSNPEFLKEGSALSDARQPDRIVIGSDSAHAAQQLQELYTQMDCPILVTTPQTAEMIKYASNAFLSVKISFVNELARLCDLTFANVGDVTKGMALDQRIGSHFLKAGIGYGGSCFPKDVQALLHTAKTRRMSLTLLASAPKINDSQPLYYLKQLGQRLGTFRGKTIAILGIAFKPHTDDTREAPALRIIAELLKKRAFVNAHDPVAKLPSAITGKRLIQCSTMQEALRQADAVIVCTEWPQYVDADWRQLRALMHGCDVLDGRNALDGQHLADLGYRYLGVGNRGRAADSL